MGLMHPHEIYTPDDGWQADWLPSDSDLISVMSYGSPRDNTVTPAPDTYSLTPAFADIHAIQERFDDFITGPVQVNHGDSFYGYDPDIENRIAGGESIDYKTLIWHWFTDYRDEYGVNRTWLSVPSITIYDTGGIDTLDLSNEGLDGNGYIHAADMHLDLIDGGADFTDTLTSQVVNLNPGYTSNVYGAHANLVIANGTVIENYIAGAGDDHVTGNLADNRLEGRDGDDTLLGGVGDDLLIGGTGSDTLDGGEGSDTAAYTGSAAAVTVNLTDGVASGGHADGDTLTSIENLTGSGHDDSLTGDAADNVLEGAGGADALDGGAGADTAAYASSNAGVTIDLSLETATGGHAEGDTLTNIEHLLGSRYPDVLTGDAAANRLDGGPGNDRLTGGAGADTLVGGPGLDTAMYATSPAAVTINLLDGTATGGDAEGDTLTTIENLTGSAHDDTLTGDAGNNVLKGGAGADALDGGAGIDTASYAGSASRVDVRLSGTVVNHGDATGDTLSGIENLVGSAHNDTLAGNGQANILTGLAGNDLLWGSSGDDLLTGGAGRGPAGGRRRKRHRLLCRFTPSRHRAPAQLRHRWRRRPGRHLPLHRGRDLDGRGRRRANRHPA